MIKNNTEKLIHSQFLSSLLKWNFISDFVIVLSILIDALLTVLCTFLNLRMYFQKIYYLSSYWVTEVEIIILSLNL